VASYRVTTAFPERRVRTVAVREPATYEEVLERISEL
jgi:hypothetical protein